MIRALLLTILVLGPAAGAQITLPRGPLRGLPGTLPGGVGLPLGAQQTLNGLNDDVDRLEDARKLGVHLLLRRHSDVVEADPNGNPIVRGELLAFSPSDATLARAVSAGFSIRRAQALAPLGIRIVVLEAPRAMATSRALSLLRRLDPVGAYDFNNIYIQGGTTQGSATGGPAGVPSGAGAAAGATAVPLGLIDGGVGTAQTVFQGSVIHQHGCDGAAIPSAHGTEVASLMVGRSARFGGAAPGATLYAADVYCGKPGGGAVDAIAEALAWLVAQNVPVINVSLVGPPNVLLQQVVGRVVAQGFLIVAAVGNDGPAAPALYPAAYPGVVGVTAVDARRRVIFEAERGPQVMFAAPGAGIPAATVSDGFAAVRGTSFAAPLVAGLLAARLKSIGRARDSDLSPDPVAAAHAAVAALAQEAIPLGSLGRNTVFGYGLVGADLPSPRP
jgi:hypothetical protein